MVLHAIDGETAAPRASSGSRQPARQAVATLAQLARFDEIIDARSESEYADDHVPGAINCPVLNDEERARIGTLYKQVSPFAAKRLGAAWVARNIATHLEQRFQDRERGWRPLVYCWRGGKRSGAFVTILRQIGWDACQLEGGYKAYRRHVVARLQEVPKRFRYRVVSGATGSGKSRLLAALAALGEQVLDLESLAAHKGSVLGDLPGAPQPSQKMFESRVLEALNAFNPAREILVEAESRKIGSLQVPETLLASMRASPCVRLDATLAARVSFLLRDYAYFLTDPVWLKRQLDCLAPMHGSQRLEEWHALIDRGEWPRLVEELLVRHYDPLYQRSQGRNYAGYGEAAVLETEDLSENAIALLASELVARLGLGA